MKDSFFKNRQFNLLFISSIFFMMSFTAPLAELTDYLETFSDKSWIGVVIAMFTAGALLSRFYSGRMADRIGRLPVMLVGTIVTAVCGYLYIFTTTLTAILLLRFIHGLSTGWRPVGTTAFLSDVIPVSRRGEALGYLGIAGSSGSALGPYLGSVLKEEFSFEAMFIAASVFGVISLILTLGLKESLPNPEKFKWYFLKLSEGDLVSKAAFPALVAITLETFGFGTVITVSPDFVDYLGFEYKGSFLLIIVLSSIAARLYAGKASDRLNKVKLLQFGMWLGAFALVIIGLSESKEMVVTGAILYGLSIGVTRPTIFAWTADLAKKGKIAVALATMLIGLEVGILMGALVSGRIFNGDIEHLHYSYFVAAFVSVLAAVYLFNKSRLGAKIV